jgi:hypothetical protein
MTPCSFVEDSDVSEEPASSAVSLCGHAGTSVRGGAYHSHCGDTSVHGLTQYSHCGDTLVRGLAYHRHCGDTSVRGLTQYSHCGDTLVRGLACHRHCGDTSVNVLTQYSHCGDTSVRGLTQYSHCSDTSKPHRLTPVQFCAPQLTDIQTLQPTGRHSNMWLSVQYTDTHGLLGAWASGVSYTYLYIY